MDATNDGNGSHSDDLAIHVSSDVKPYVVSYESINNKRDKVRNLHKTVINLSRWITNGINGVHNPNDLDSMLKLLHQAYVFLDFAIKNIPSE